MQILGGGSTFHCHGCGSDDDDDGYDGGSEHGIDGDEDDGTDSGGDGTDSDGDGSDNDCDSDDGSDDGGTLYTTPDYPLTSCGFIYILVIHLDCWP